jgi:hypothetical protein
VCHYLTAALPEGADLPALRPILKTHGQPLIPLNNPWVEAQLPEGMAYYSAAGKYCDCGTAVGWLARQDPVEPASHSARLRWRGWSEARVERWLQEKARAQEKRERERQGGTPHEEAERWAAFIRALLVEGGLACFGLLLHWYSGAPETERLRLRDTRVSPPGADAILWIEEDVLTLFKPGQQATWRHPAPSA